MLYWLEYEKNQTHLILFEHPFNVSNMIHFCQENSTFPFPEQKTQKCIGDQSKIVAIYTLKSVFLLKENNI